MPNLGAACRLVRISPSLASPEGLRPPGLNAGRRCGVRWGVLSPGGSWAPLRSQSDPGPTGTPKGPSPCHRRAPTVPGRTRLPPGGAPVPGPPAMDLPPQAVPAGPGGPISPALVARGGFRALRPAGMAAGSRAEPRAGGPAEGGMRRGMPINCELDPGNQQGQVPAPSSPPGNWGIDHCNCGGNALTPSQP